MLCALLSKMCLLKFFVSYIYLGMYIIPQLLIKMTGSNIFLHPASLLLGLLKSYLRVKENISLCFPRDHETYLEAPRDMTLITVTKAPRDGLYLVSLVFFAAQSGSYTGMVCDMSFIYLYTQPSCAFNYSMKILFD